MEKINILVASLLLVGCASNPVEPICGEKPTFKKYDIVMPQRPALQVDKLTPSSTIGEAARVYETDLTNMIEYSLQLENVLDPIVSDQGAVDDLKSSSVK